MCEFRTGYEARTRASGGHRDKNELQKRRNKTEKGKLIKELLPKGMEKWVSQTICVKRDGQRIVVKSLCRLRKKSKIAKVLVLSVVGAN